MRAPPRQIIKNTEPMLDRCSEAWQYSLKCRVAEMIDF